MSNLWYGDARESDVAQIQQVAAHSWRATYKNIYAPEFIERFLSANYSPEGLLNAIRASNQIMLVARSGEQVVGFCHFGFGREGAQLFRLYVAPTHWRFGIGTRLVQLMESRWVAHGVDHYFCYVHRQNQIGRAFYEKHGFKHDPLRDHGDEFYLVRRIP